MVVETNWIDKKKTCLSALRFDFILLPSADRANAVVYRYFHGCHDGYFEVLFGFDVGPCGMCFWTSEKHSYLILLMVRRLEMVAETVLGRNF